MGKGLCSSVSSWPNANAAICIASSPVTRCHLLLRHVKQRQGSWPNTGCPCQSLVSPAKLDCFSFACRGTSPVHAKASSQESQSGKVSRNKSSWTLMEQDNAHSASTITDHQHPKSCTLIATPQTLHPKSCTPTRQPQIPHPKSLPPKSHTPNPTPQSREQGADLLDFGAEALTELDAVMCTTQMLHPKRYTPSPTPKPHTPNPTPPSPEQDADLFDFGAEALTAFDAAVCHSDGTISIHAHSCIDGRRRTVKPAHRLASSQPFVLLPCRDLPNFASEVVTMVY